MAKWLNIYIFTFRMKNGLTNSILSKKNQVDVVASRYNSKYIKNFKYINRIFIFDKTQNKILDFFNLFLQIKNKNYDYLIVLEKRLYFY